MNLKLCRISHLVILIIFQLIVESLAQHTKSAEQVVLERIFKDDRYDRRVRPVSNGTGPVLVSVNLFLRNVEKVDDTNHVMNVQLTFRQRWIDSRLVYSASGLQYVTLLTPERQIWRPDTFFSNEREGKYHELMTKNEFVRISSRGEVMQSTRISLSLSCPMTLKKFPFDKQTCPLRLASYGYTAENVKYKWEDEDPVQLADNVQFPPPFRFDGEVVTSYCDTTTNTGRYSCLRLDISLKRIASSYLVHVYIPCTMMIIVAYLSFWISLQAVVARVMVSLLTLLVLAIQTSEVNKSFPLSTRTRAVDTFTGVCLTFVFATLIEFVVVSYLGRRSPKETSTNDEEDENPTANPGRDEEISLKENQVESKNEPGVSNAARRFSERAERAVREYVARFDSLPEKVDGVARVAYPLLYVLFNIIYWPVYCF